jgi:hypothetical protein
MLFSISMVMMALSSSRDLVKQWVRDTHDTNITVVLVL